MEKPKVPRVGVGVMFVRNGQVLLGRRHDDAEKADSLLHGEGTWTLPGGKLDFHERPTDCARREALEECAIEPKDLKMVSVSNDTVPDAHFVTLGFLSKDFEGKPQAMEPDEITEWKWFPFDELPGNIFPPSGKVIKNYLAGEIYKH